MGAQMDAGCGGHIKHAVPLIPLRELDSEGGLRRGGVTCLRSAICSEILALDLGSFRDHAPTVPAVPWRREARDEIVFEPCCQVQPELSDAQIGRGYEGQNADHPALGDCLADVVVAAHIGRLVRPRIGIVVESLADTLRGLADIADVCALCKSVARIGHEREIGRSLACEAKSDPAIPVEPPFADFGKPDPLEVFNVHCRTYNQFC